VQNPNKDHLKAAILKAVEVIEITSRCTGSPIKPAPGELHVRSIISNANPQNISSTIGAEL
jgi:hypothetical protein